MVRNILVDTSAIFALLSPDDRFHAQSRNTFSEFVERGHQLYTTSYVLVESSALIHRRLGFEVLRAFIQAMEGVCETIWIDRSTHEEIWNRMRAKDGVRLSLVDWSVIVSAEKTRSAIFAFDSDFSLEGLTVIPAPAG